MVLEHTKVLAELDQWSQLIVHLNPDLTDGTGIITTTVHVLVNCELRQSCGLFRGDSAHVYIRSTIFCDLHEI